MIGPKMLGMAGAALAAIVVAGCGGSGSSSSSVSGAAAHHRGHAHVRLYHLTLAPAAHGPAGARGGATVALHGHSKVCWRFAHLRGFTDATTASLHSASGGAAAVSLGSGAKLHHRGCVAASAATITGIARNPGGFTLTIDSARYPAGAAQARL